VNLAQELGLGFVVNRVLKQAKEMTVQNWKTTLAGLIGGLVMAWANYAGPNTWQGYLAALAPVAIGILAKDFNISLTPDEIGAITKSVAKTSVLLFALSVWLAIPGRAQSTVSTPPAPQGTQNLYAAGASYNPGGSPGIAGSALYARNLNTGATLPTFAFTSVDAVTTSVKPFTVSTNVGAGIAQQVATLGKIPIYMPTAVGISWNGANTGWQWNGGALISIPVKGFYLMPSVRFLKSSVSNNSGYQLIGGLLVGWGK
jgi:hypothetical protein